MRMTRSGAVWLWLMLPVAAWAEDIPEVLRVGATTLAFLPRAGVGTDEGFLQVEPTLILDGGAEFGLNLGTPVRLRLWGDGGAAGFVRREDWDSLSDFGQVVRGLKLGSNDAPVGVWFGALESYSLLSAQLVRRYSNRGNPDDHPVGSFRQGYFGPDYELARFNAAGPEGLPLAEAHFPDGTSAHGEAEVGWNSGRYGGLSKHLKLSPGAEVFSSGRFDVDERMAMHLFARSLEAALKGLGIGMGRPGARSLGADEARWRFLGGKLHAMGTGGTLLFPAPEGTLRLGAFASVGLEVDHAR
ncbi:hypothetical protein [Corallococcus sp. AS-1-12]|uniref:hypothetical protein n=1 Tax=Corallococcus sp. AS-1-12 TaxID=2874598 RepID=UPI001CBE30A9|nr:hypothetical protein [Corallococcus sp. AS-1-12]MBZ4329906.1 hypothetical protein [Corallococcus sp. AS-1-12]